MKTVTNQVQFYTDHPEWGEIYQVKCPDCGVEMTVMRYSPSGDMTPVCKCRLKWKIEIKAVGES